MKESEFGYIKWIQTHLKYPSDVAVGSGDDAAVIRISKGRYLIATTDTIVEGIDFVFHHKVTKKITGKRLRDLCASVASPEEVGHKAVAISLSDIAAMGQGKPPLYALIIVALPKRLNNISFRHRLFKGMHRIVNRFGVRIIGGDISAINGPLTITSTLLAYSSLPILKRSGAKTGDIIMVTGKLGGSILGKHLTFTPRIKEALLLNSRYKINSMIDISDGLAADLNHICEASKVGAQLVENRMPISDAVRKMSKRPGHSPISYAFSDGEDFELLFTAPPDQARRILKNNKMPVWAIGFMTKDKGIYLEDSKGVIKAIKPKGYRHF